MPQAQSQSSQSLLALSFLERLLSDQKGGYMVSRFKQDSIGKQLTAEGRDEPGLDLMMSSSRPSIPIKHLTIDSDSPGVLIL